MTKIGRIHAHPSFARQNPISARDGRDVRPHLPRPRRGSRAFRRSTGTLGSGSSATGAISSVTIQCRSGFWTRIGDILDYVLNVETTDQIPIYRSADQLISELP